MSELPSSSADARRRREQAGERSGMPTQLASELASYITSVFQVPELLGEGVEPSWRLGRQESQRISSNRVNIEIEVNDKLYNLPRERHYSIDEDSEDKINGYEYLEEKARFHLESITAVSYALAVYINSDRVVADNNSEASQAETRSLLIDRNMITREFASARDYTFYPQAFHPVYGNISSSRPPMFLDSLFAAMKGNMSDRNEGADVLSFGYFQGYSNIKRSVRHSPHDLLATKGYATAALTVPTSDAGATWATSQKRERLLRIVRGPDESKPFARERQQINVAIGAEEVAFRLEQVVSLDMRRMVGGQRTFETVIRPIFQMMRFFLVEHESYVHIFRSMPLEIFPRIMCAYSRLFEVVIGEMERQFVIGGEQGLDLARSEAIAVIDRLGGYMFSGHPRHLPKTILRPLGTLGSLWAGGWPFIDPAVLNLGASGSSGGAVINMSRWPHSAKTGRPELLHVRELHHHYGARVASCRESAVWFAQLGEAAFTSKTAVTSFAQELIRELWIPQTKDFIIQQLRRRLHEGSSNQGRDPITMEDIAMCERAISTWDAATDAFTWRALRQLCQGLKPGGKRVAVTVSGQRARQDFVSEMVRVVGSEKGRDAFSAKNATWPLTLHFAIANSRKSQGGIDLGMWVGAVLSCLVVSGIEWVPDSVRGRFTSRSVVRLGGAAIPEPVPSGPPGSLRREAQDTEIRHNRVLRQRAQRQEQHGARIDFGCPVPFTNIPNLILSGFEKAKAMFSNKGDSKVLEHYQLAINCLAENIDDYRCQLMLMITLTICSSSETPEVALKANKFTIADKRKDPGQLALVMVTRMMWFLYPASFPWAKNSGGTAYDVAEMTKKVEQKGCNNRVLKVLC
ncbi:uncharacterized protein CTRU02_204880 [Colletotrichum truncatum]|uniref:Uncharacterized protein n=1 Tax=Colletotrichum truncatum TaxID=5467 RepID=A0ACC3Z2F8_COLTU